MIDIEGRGGGYCSVHCYFIFSKGKRGGVVLLVPKRGDDYVFICIHIKQSNSFMLKLWKAFIMCIDIVLFVRMKHIKQKCYMNTCMRLKYILIEKLKGKQ